jgi:hypothetical protein
MSDPTRKDDAPEDLLVFLANNTLEGAEHKQQELAVAADSGLKAELTALQMIRREMQAMDTGRSPGEFGLARLLRDVDATPRSVDQQTSTSRWKYAAVAAIALLAVQVTAPLFAPGFDAELADGGSDEAVQTGPVLTVAFAATASEQDIRALLLKLDLSIISGPSALGLYTLVARDAKAAHLAFERLSAAPDLIESVELGESR